MKKTKKMKTIALLLATLTCGGVWLAACGNGDLPDVDLGEYVITLDYCDRSSRPLRVYVDKEGGSVARPDDPVRNGYIFNGWNTASDGSGSEVSFPYVPSADTTIYATWAIRSISVNFNWNTGVAADNVKIEKEFGQSLTEEDVPADAPINAGYKFFKWTTVKDNISTIAVFPENDIKRDITYYAFWIPENTPVYTVNYVTGTDDKIASVEFADGYSQPYYLPTLTRTGHDLIGWSTVQGSASAEIAIDAPYTPAATGTLYAVWERKSYEVKFNNVVRNEKGLAMATEEFFVTTAKYEDALSAPSTEPTRLGYEFIGWYNAQNGGTKVDFPYTVVGATNLYARWRANSVTTDIFDAEFVEIDPNAVYYGYSGTARGYSIIGMEEQSATTRHEEAASESVKKNKYYVTYQQTENATLTFKFESSAAVSGATLVLCLGSELGPMTLAPSTSSSAYGYTIKVNGAALDYGSIAVGDGAFKEYTVCNIDLKEGENTVTLITSNNISPGGTQTAYAPTVDYLKIGNHGAAVLSWHPEYDNLYKK